MASENKDDPIVLITAGQRKECPNCSAVMLFPRMVTERDLPATIGCPYCHFEYNLLRATDRNFLHMPRIDPAIATRGAWHAKLSSGKSGGVDTHPVASPGAIVDEMTAVPDQLRKRSFREQADELSALTLAAMQLANTMASDLQAFKDSFQSEMETHYDHGHEYRKGWTPEYLHEFIDHPYVCFPMEAGIECRLLVCPKFYRRLHGVPIAGSGGFYFQLVTPYFLMGNGIDHWANMVLNMPDLSLEVMGQKIVGRDLARVYQDIPGVITDDTHTEFNPSIRMTREHHRQSRQWLANHGIAPWPAQTTPEEDIFPFQQRQLPDELGENYARFQSEFLEVGRMALLCEDKVLAVQRIKALASCYKSPTLIVLGSMDHRVDWTPKDAPLEDRWTQRLAWNHYAQFQSFKGWDEFGMVVVDADHVPLEFLEALYSYPGRLLLYGTDAILDSLEGNVRSQALYGLVHSCSLFQSFQWKEKFWTGHKKTAGSLVEEALRQLISGKKD